MKQPPDSSDQIDTDLLAFVFFIITIVTCLGFGGWIAFTVLNS